MVALVDADLLWVPIVMEVCRKDQATLLAVSGNHFGVTFLHPRRPPRAFMAKGLPRVDGARTRALTQVRERGRQMLVEQILISGDAEAGRN
jgi:hypothetical protein